MKVVTIFLRVPKEELERRLKEMGESLWHCNVRCSIKRLRKRNNKRRVLAKIINWNWKSFVTNKTTKKKMKKTAKKAMDTVNNVMDNVNQMMK